MVKITSVPTNKQFVDTSNMQNHLNLIDKNASKQTFKLASYLKLLSNSNKVLFGHQNDANKCVCKFAKGNSDVKEMVGTYAGLVGIDTLSLTGSEIENEYPVQEAIKICRKATSEGAIITLSTHMPNFTDHRYLQSDGSYNFKTAGFLDCKNLTGDCINRILPNGDCNDAYKSYLDLIVEFAKGLTDIPILFRPLHENNGDWFWWGSGTSVSSYIEVFRYTVEYLKSNGVNNFLYVYSPNGPFENKTEYLERYPGDDYIDIIAFDYYDDYNILNEKYRDSFMKKIEQTCKIISIIANDKNKISAISETGSRVMRENNENAGLKPCDNPMFGKNWYKLVNDIAIKTGMAYYLVWGNFGEKNFYLPYKKSDKTGHEMINEFIDFYNEDSTVFASNTNFYA